jgi:hypothetical protein
VCSGATTLADAQQAIASDWYAIYLTLSNVDSRSPTAIQPEPEAPSSVGTQSPAESSQSVTVLSVTGGARASTASVAIQTTPGATCSVRYVTPAGSISTAAGQGASSIKTADADGRVAWSWRIAPTTEPGQGSIKINCSTGTATAGLTVS